MGTRIRAVPMPNGLGGFGSSVATDATWTDLDELGCHGTRRLFCFEQ